VSIPESACGFVRRPIADACDDPNHIASRAADTFAIPTLPPESGGSVWYVVAKRAEQRGNARWALLRRALGYYKKVGLVKAIDLGFERLFDFPGIRSG
jgi:hypothetical protein